MTTRSSFITDRRSFMRGALAAGAVLTAARLSRASALSAIAPERHFAPVKVSRDRIIREVVGLRPYRPDGFVVSAEKIGAKLLVHNYGHGGAGITLSWGTASLAVDLARDFIQTNPPSRVARRADRRSATPHHFAVLGCGVSGL